jgi:hypothetical protein
MPIAPSELRANLCRIPDEAITAGVPVEVVRKGTVLTIVPPKRVSKLANLKKRPGLCCDPDDIVSMDWVQETRSVQNP